MKLVWSVLLGMARPSHAGPSAEALAFVALWRELVLLLIKIRGAAVPLHPFSAAADWQAGDAAAEALQPP